MPEPAPHAHLTFDEVESHGEPCRPLEFPSPIVGRGVRVNALVVDSNTGSRKVWSGVIHREDLGVASYSSDRNKNNNNTIIVVQIMDHNLLRMHPVDAFRMRYMDPFGRVWC